MKLPMPRAMLTGLTLALLAGLLAFTSGASTAVAAADKASAAEPKLTVRATPLVSFSPVEISAQAALEGGSDHYEAFYCPSVEWSWGDGTTSEASADCEPYQGDKSEIERHYYVRHVYRNPGRFRVMFSLKKDGKKLATASAEVIVRPGLGGR